MRRFLLIAVTSVTLLAACGSSNESASDTASADNRPTSSSSSSSTTSSTEPEPTCGSGGEIGEPVDERTMTTSNGEERTYLVDVPSGYDESTPADVVFNFHGRGSNAAQQYVYGNFTDLAERDGVILITPNSLVRNGSMQWSPGTPGSGEDLDFVAELVAETRTDYCTDQFFAAGMSSGGAMTTALACQADSDFEAFGPVTLWFYVDACEDAPPRPIIEFHGTDDEVVPFEGSGTRRSVLEAGAAWAEHNGCDPEPTIEPIGEVDHHQWTSCDAVTELYVVNGGGHTWPGSIEVEGLGAVTDDISASEIIWDLFFTTA
jgi:polyhydroxybutyrate depolymerase